MDMITVLCEGTMKAAVLISYEKNITIDAKTLSEALRKTIIENLGNIKAEWKEALDANLGELWLRQLVNTQCNELALKALSIDKSITLV